MKQGLTRLRPMALRVVSRYPSYCTMHADHYKCACFCRFIYILPHPLLGWHYDHGPSHVGALVKRVNVNKLIQKEIFVY